MSELRPYRGLARYRYTDARLFAGRGSEIQECLQKLTESGNIFILHGNSGCGKSSFLEAGLVPRLAADHSEGNTRLKPVHLSENKDAPFVIRLGWKPLAAIGRAVFKLVQRVDGALLGDKSADDFLALTSDELFDFLSDISLRVPANEKALLVLDQAETVIGSGRQSAEELDAFFNFLAQVTLEPLFIKILISLRTDFKGRFDDFLLKHCANHSLISTYYLDDITAEGILEAITHPASLPECAISYETSVPLRIGEDLDALRGKWPVLPVLQVVCDRLVTHAKRSGRDRITEKDYRATGAASAQIASHIEESVVDYFTYNKPSFEVDVVGQADRWQIALAQLADVDVDGRTRAKVGISEQELSGIAAHYGCRAIPEMLDWLRLENQYILERVEPDLELAGDTQFWKLIHDSCAVALRPWRDEHPDGSSHATSIRETPKAEYLSEAELYGDVPPDRVEFTTINDLIWDHLIPVYARHRGFSNRLGLDFRMDPEFDLSISDDKDNYYTRLFDAAKKSTNLLAVLPGSVFPQVLKEPWITVGIPNIYRGYAIVGRRQARLVSMRQRDNAKSPSIRDMWKRLDRLAEVLAARSTKLQSYENEGAQFVNSVLRLGGHPERDDIEVATLMFSGRFQGLQDPMFTALVDREFDFVLGPAPSRALAEQAGFEVFADFESVYSLASVGRQGAGGYENEKENLDTLLLHENWVVNMPASEDSSVLMRLAAVLFYTVDYIRENPDDFVRFLSNQVYATRRLGAYPLQREFIGRAVRSCYEYIAPNEHPFTYFNPSSPFSIPNSYDTKTVTGSFGHNAVYRSWSSWRAKCDEFLLATVDRWRGSWPVAARESFRRAEYHCRIYNYYDAYRFLKHTESIMSDTPSAGPAEAFR